MDRVAQETKRELCSLCGGSKVDLTGKQCFICGGEGYIDFKRVCPPYVDYIPPAEK